MPQEVRDISYEREGHVGIIEIQRPPHNFFDAGLIRDIARILEEADEDSEVRCMVLGSQGRSFCAGAKFDSRPEGVALSEAITETGFGSSVGPLYEAAVRLFRTKTPVVAAIQGPATGGGLGLALAADFRIAAPEARFWANFVKLGIHPGFGLSLTLPRLIGPQRASWMLLSGTRLRAEEAREIGLVDEVVPRDAVRDRAVEWAKTIAANAPLAVASTRATLRAGLAEEVAERTLHELKEQQWLRRTSDAREGIRAVADHRPGRFVGA